MGKQIHAKFRIMDIRALPSLARVQTAVPVPSPAPTPAPPPPLATPVALPTRGNPAPAPRATSAVATSKPASVPAIEEAKAPQVEPDAKLELTVTSDPSGAAVEINGVSVGTTPVTVSLAKGTNCTLSVKKHGFVPWVTHYSAAVPGKFGMNANLTREVFH